MVLLFCRLSGLLSKERMHTFLLDSLRSFGTTQPLFMEPPRKKRRLDPAVFRARVEKKIKKYEKEVEKLEKAPRQFIPILEYQLTNSEIRDLSSRPGRSFEDAGTSEASIRAAKRLWSFYCHIQTDIECRSIKRVEKAQKHALATLKAIDEDLYNKTVSVDDLTLIPYFSNHMRKETPPNPDYVAPDGYSKDITKQWIM